MTTGLITEGQKKQYRRFIEDLVERGRKEVLCDHDRMQTFLGNGDKVMDDMIASFTKHSVADNRFWLLTSFKFTVPRGYNHGTQLATFAAYAKKEKFYFYNEAITDTNFAKATNRLVPGKTYGGKIFGIKKEERVSSEDCLAFLASQRTMLVGAQGISLVRQLKKNVFPIGKWTVSFDEKEALWADADGRPWVPYMFRRSVGDSSFRLGGFERDWLDGYCLLSVCDLRA